MLCSARGPRNQIHTRVVFSCFFKAVECLVEYSNGFHVSGGSHEECLKLPFLRLSFCLELCWIRLGGSGTRAEAAQAERAARTAQAREVPQAQGAAEVHEVQHADDAAEPIRRRKFVFEFRLNSKR